MPAPARIAFVAAAFTAISLVVASTFAEVDAHANPEPVVHAASIIGARGASSPRPSAEPSKGGACPANMVEIEGEYCPVLEQTCVKWKDDEKVQPRRCAEFAPSSACKTATVKKHFCVDRYEFPNRAGEQPTVMKSFVEAKQACEGLGKRLCGGSEWTLACEGKEHLPYPYGTKRDSDACNIDKPHPTPNERALANPKTRDAEVARLWQGEASGTRAACVSPYGVHDMTGNVDEWVVNESGAPYVSGLKGGYWGPVRDRCRPMTTAHGPEFSYYQVGFRCCADAK